MTRILVTGGAGFLGSNLCARLVRNPENQVIALDNLFTGRIENLQELTNLPNFTFIEHDITQYIDMPVDQIYNAACPASPPAYQKSPTGTTKTCVLGILNMLELAKKYNATLLQFSTSEVYGEPQVHPQVDYHREFGTKIKVVRIFNTYGPQMDPDDGRVVSNFIVQALQGKDLTVYGDGSQTRSFCYVDDLIDGICRMMNESRDDFMGPVNLGNPGEFTVLELAEKVIAMTGSNSRIVRCALPADDPTQRRPEISLAKETLGWAPSILLDEGLNQTINYFSNLGNERSNTIKCKRETGH